MAFDGFFDQAEFSVPEPVTGEPDLPAPVLPEPVRHEAAEPSYARYTGPGFIEAGAVQGRRDAEPETVTEPAAPAAEAPLEPPVVGGSPWEPVPVPPPTYTMKPPAPPRRPRYEPDEPLLPPLESMADLPADELEEILDRRWAVND
jgi:hypothetical protein